MFTVIDELLIVDMQLLLLVCRAAYDRLCQCSRVLWLQ